MTATTSGTASQFMGDEGQQALQMPRQDADVIATLGGYDALGVDVGDTSLNATDTGATWDNSSTDSGTGGGTGPKP